MEKMKLRFSHRAFQPDEQSVIEVGHIVDSVFVHDKRVKQTA